ncbi:MAG: hypothetical protein IPK16_15085 [Anaerolineales bacterium]|nr:hypothetical protein [Anaerolineales bacterium]
MAGTFAPRDDSFDGKVKLTGVDYGRAAVGEAMIDATSRQIPAGSPIWVVLQWVSQAPIDYDLKTSLILKDEAGHLAGQVDDLLVDDLYPFERMWAEGETTNTYHVLPTLPAIPPGKYQLFLKVYEDKTPRPYPKLDAQGNPALIDVLIGSVDIMPATQPQTVAPQYPLQNAPDMAPNLKLIGYDLPVSSVAPGGQIPVTFFWEANESPAADYEVELQLRTADDDVAAQTISPIGGAYPTSQWRAQEVVRDWQDLTIPPALANGTYELWIAVNDEATSKGEMKLGDLTVEGRPHTFEAPPIGVSAEATFGNLVNLLGLKSAPAQVVQAGEQIAVPLVWRVAQPTPLPLVRFVHLLGADGAPLTQSDGIPCSGACPASTWVKDEILDDELTLTIPPDAEAGDYTLVTGWYDQNTLQRLNAMDGEGAPLLDQLMPLPVKVTVASD